MDISPEWSRASSTGTGSMAPGTPDRGTDVIRKSFSWNAFLSELEGALPDSSYIISLAPSFIGEASLDLRVKVVSRSLDDLLAFVNNLSARNFKGIRVENESANEQGQLNSDITFTYERNL